MPPPKKRESSVILIDVNSSEEFKKQAVQAYADICARKFFQNIEDYTQLILVNTAETKNAGNDEFPGKYEHIFEATEMVWYDPKNKKFIEEAKPAAGNWLEGLLLGAEILEKKSEEKGIYSLQMLLMSDLKTPLQLKEKTANNMLEHIITKARDVNIYIFVLGPEVDLPFRLNTKSDIYRWMQKLELKESEEGNSNYKFAKRLVQGCKGLMCNLEIGADLFTFYKRCKGKQPWLVPLTFEDVEIPAITSKILMPNAVVNPTPVVEGMIETVYVNAEDETEVITGEVVGGLAVYGKLILIPPDIDKAIKEGERYFKLLGFTEATNIPVHYMKSTATNVVLVDLKRNQNAKALEYVIRACHNLNLYGIAQKVHMKNCSPKLFCLIPEVSEETVRFLMPELEYAEGFTGAYRESDIHAEKYQVQSDQQKDEVYRFLDSKDCTDTLKIHPNLKADVYNKKIFRQFTQKYMEEEVTPSSLNLGDLYTEASEESYEALQSSWLGEEAEEAEEGTSKVDEEPN